MCNSENFYATQHAFSTFKLVQLTQKPQNFCRKFQVSRAFLSEDERWLAVTVNSERYVAMLQGFFVPYLEESEWNTSHVSFQQNGASADTANVLMNFTRQTLAGRARSRKGDRLSVVTSSQRSPDSALTFLFIEVPEAQSVTRQTKPFFRVESHSKWNWGNFRRNVQEILRILSSCLQECIEFEWRHL